MHNKKSSIFIHPLHRFFAGGVSYVAQESGLRLRTDRIRAGYPDRVLFGVGLFLLFRRIWDRCLGVLVCEEKIIGIYLSQGE